MTIPGRGGRDLNEAWRDGAEAYLGLAVARLPEHVHALRAEHQPRAGSIIFMLESQIGYVVAAIRDARRLGARLDGRPPRRAAAFNARDPGAARGHRLDRRLHELVPDRVGQGHEQLAGLHLEYRRRTRFFDAGNYDIYPPEVRAVSAAAGGDRNTVERVR